MKISLALILSLVFSAGLMADDSVVTRFYRVGPDFVGRLEQRYAGDTLADVFSNAGVPLPKGAEVKYNKATSQLQVMAAESAHGMLKQIVTEVETAQRPINPRGFHTYLCKAKWKFADGSPASFKTDHSLEASGHDLARWAITKDGVIELRSHGGKLAYTAILKPDGATLELSPAASSSPKLTLKDIE